MAAVMNPRKGVDFQIADPPRRVTDPIGFAETGTSRPFQEFPCHLHVTEAVKEEDRPRNGYPFVVADTKEDKARFMKQGYAPLPPTAKKLA